MTNNLLKEQNYLEIFLQPIRKCQDYRPKLGQGNSNKGLSFQEFKVLYGADPFYSWIGLDTDLMYAAHRAAGGITSIYRQIGIVFEVRQGYKSKDSKRQNADIDNATVAWANGYLPVFAIFSAQIDSDIVLRYRNNRCGILVGRNNDDPQTSLVRIQVDDEDSATTNFPSNLAKTQHL